MSVYRTVGLLVKPDEARIAVVLQQLIDLLSAQGVRLVFEHSCQAYVDVAALTLPDVLAQVDLLLVIGGDGTLLRGGRAAARQQKPIVGVNAGRLGFLVDTSPEDVSLLVQQIVNGQLREDQRFLLQAEVRRAGEVIHSGVAVNDVVLHSRTDVRMIDLTLSVDDVFVSQHRADGMIVSTPTGSTAYALSSGGPILHPASDAMVIVPICPHSLHYRPLVVNRDSRVKLTVHADSRVLVQVSFDAREAFPLQPKDQVVVSQLPECLHLFHPQDYDYFDILRRKLNWGV